MVDIDNDHQESLDQCTVRAANHLLFTNLLYSWFLTWLVRSVLRSIDTVPYAQIVGTGSTDGDNIAEVMNQLAHRIGTLVVSTLARASSDDAHVLLNSFCNVLRKMPCDSVQQYAMRDLLAVFAVDFIQSSASDGRKHQYETIFAAVLAPLLGCSEAKESNSTTTVKDAWSLVLELSKSDDACAINLLTHVMALSTKHRTRIEEIVCKRPLHKFEDVMMSHHSGSFSNQALAGSSLELLARTGTLFFNDNDSTVCSRDILRHFCKFIQLAVSSKSPELLRSVTWVCKIISYLPGCREDLPALFNSELITSKYDGSYYRIHTWYYKLELVSRGIMYV